MKQALLISTLVAGLTTGAAAQTTWYVDDDHCPGPGSGTEGDPFCSIQDAIHAAADGHEVLVAPGTYNELIDFLGKAITLRSEDPTDPQVVANTIIDGDGDGSVVTCVSGESPTTVIDGLTIRGGSGTPVEVVPGLIRLHGGGIYVDDSHLTLSRCRIVENTGEYGGGVSVNEGGLTMTDCLLEQNAAEVFSGGGLRVAFAAASITRCVFSGNIANEGAGLWLRETTGVEVTDCRFIGNEAGSFGGGVYLVLVGPTTLTNCVFLDNTSGNSGGGLANDDSSPVLVNCLFSGNHADEEGGAVWHVNAAPVMTNTTIVGNTATFVGGGIFNGYQGTTLATNTILWGNTAMEGAQFHNDADPLSSFSYCNVEGSGGSQAWDSDLGIDGGGNIDADPLFVDPAADLRLLPGAPCIDAGDNTAVPEDITTDLGDDPRFHDDPGTPDSGNPDGVNPIVDMGAYEFQGIAPCPGDINNSGVVDVVDLVNVVLLWGTDDPAADINNDGIVDVQDLVQVILNWGPCE